MRCFRVGWQMLDCFAARATRCYSDWLSREVVRPSHASECASFESLAELAQDFDTRSLIKL